MKAYLSSSSGISSICSRALLASTLGLVALATPWRAEALTCGPVYSSQIINGGTFSPRLYQLSGTTATFDSTAGQNLNGIGQAANGDIFFDNGANITIRRFDGTTTTALAGNWTSFGGNPGSSGQGNGIGGNIYYVGNNRHLYRVSTGGVNTDVGLLSASAPGDAAIWAAMNAGDLAADANGRMFWLGSSGASTYLFRIDPVTLLAYNLGTYGPSGATGLAFDNTGKFVSTLITGNTTAVYSIDLGSSNTAGVNLGNATGFSANGAALDLASCNQPLLNPALTTTKSVVNITRGQTPATLAAPGDILEYTVTVTNSGNLLADSVTLLDAIPANTTYIAGSTTLNGTAVADAPAGTMPYSPASTGTREVHTAGRLSGDVLVGASVAAVVKFRVTVGPAPLPTTIDNQATATYQTITGGVGTLQTAPSPLVSVPTPFADLSLTKTNTPGVNGNVDQNADTVVSGAITQYTITVTNNGPNAADGAVVTDPAVAGLSCSTATCSAAGGAVCPAQTGAALVAALQGAGATVSTLPSTGSVVFVLSCQVP